MEVIMLSSVDKLCPLRFYSELTHVHLDCIEYLHHYECLECCKSDTFTALTLHVTQMM